MTIKTLHYNHQSSMSIISIKYITDLVATLNSKRYKKKKKLRINAMCIHNDWLHDSIGIIFYMT